MRYAISACFALSAALLLSATLLAEGEAEGDALRSAKRTAAIASQRAEELRQDAANAENAEDRLLTQQVALGAEIDAANAQIKVAQVRMQVIAARQQQQSARLGIANEPLLRLNALLQRITRQPTMLLISRPGDRRDFVHVRATIAAIEPVIAARTVALRGQMAVQRELRGQEQIAMRALRDAKASLSDRRKALANQDIGQIDDSGALSADAATAYERAIGEGERARELIDQLDATRASSQNAAALASLDGPVLAEREDRYSRSGKPAYIAPARGSILAGFGEITPTGFRERGVRMQIAPAGRLVAPAGGLVTYAGRYRSYGNIIIIDHGGGWTTLVAYVENLGVEKGMSVKQGAYIGAARKETPEIMVELRRNGRPMDIAAMIG